MPVVTLLEQFGVGSLCLRQRPPEALRPGCARVRILAVSLNYRDLLVARGTYAPDLPLPLIPGSDAAGEVVEVGPEVESLRVGDAVCTHMAPGWDGGRLLPQVRTATLGGPADGVFGEERVLHESALVRVPEDIDPVDAACLPVAGLTAWHALGLTGAGDGLPGPPGRVLLLGTGGVSSLALVLAKAAGWQAAVISGVPAKLDRARALGADLALDRHDPGWVAAVRDWSDGGVDLVLEVGGDGTFDRSVRATRDDGCIALIGVLAQRGVPVGLAELLMRRIRVQGVFVGPRRDLQALVRFWSEHRLQAPIGAEFGGLHSIRRAYAALQSGSRFGKCVVRLDDGPAAT